MNLVSGLEEDPNAFRYTVFAATGSMAVIMAIGWLRMVRNRRSQLFLRSYARAKPQAKAIQSRSIRVPSFEKMDMAPRKGEDGGKVEKEEAKAAEEEEAEKKEQEAAKAQEAEEKKEASKDGSNL